MATLPTADGSLTLTSSRFGESYRSRHGALSEARHVFLAGSGVKDLFAEYEPVGPRQPVRILEVGFGTGLNFLVTACAALAAAASTAEDSAYSGAPRLHYTALENDPLPLTDLASLEYDTLLSPCELPGELLHWWRGLGERPGGAPTAGAPAAGRPVPGRQRFSAGDPALIELDLIVGDAREYRPPVGAFTAIYLDPFSPKTNPELWTEEFLAQLVAGLSPGGRLVTYSVSGEVRRRLAACGLVVTKVAGPSGGKREVLVAESPAA